MNDNLPPLPPCAPEFQPRWPNDPEGYTADQMHAYAIAAIAAAPQPLTVAGGAVFQDAEGKRPVTAIGQPVGRWEPTPLFPPGGAGVFLERSQAQPQPVQQGPVARVRFSDHAFDYVDWIPYQGQPLKDGDLLYTSPQAPQPQPVQQEPVGWIDAKALEELEKQEMNWMPVWNRQNGISPIALYTSPQAAQPLTETQADALNTLCKMLHSGEEVEGDDGLAMLVPIDLWNEAQDAIELLISEDDGTEAAHGVTKGTT